MFCFLTLASYIMKFWQPQKPSQTLSISEKEDWPQLQDFPHALQGIWFELLLSYSCTELLECHLKHSPRDYISLWTQVLWHFVLNEGIKYSIQYATLLYSVIFCHYRRDGSRLLYLGGWEVLQFSSVKKSCTS